MATFEEEKRNARWRIEPPAYESGSKCYTHQTGKPFAAWTYYYNSSVVDENLAHHLRECRLFNVAWRFEGLVRNCTYLDCSDDVFYKNH